MTRLSIIVPAFNEAYSLPALLDALNAQTLRPGEIIVADAGSNDGTPDLARARGATVVAGGRPGPGRNAGARAAGGGLFLFLDADVLPRPDFVARASAEFERGGYTVATSLVDPLPDTPANRLSTDMANLYLLVVQPFSPHAFGCCILVRREVHELIGGFDESLKLAEDHDYVQRAAEHGDFGILTGVRIPVSMRRMEKEPLTELAFKYLWCEMHALAGKPIHSTPFEYEFGAHAPTPATPPGRRLIDVEQLRGQLGRFENPLHRLSQTGFHDLDNWMRRDWLETARDRFRLTLDPPDVETLRRYLRRRLALIRRTGQPLRQSLHKFQSLPLKESIRLLDLDWLRSRVSNKHNDGEG